MNKIMYETSSWNEVIKPISVERETESSVWVDGRKKAKVTQYGGIFNTAKEAAEYLLQVADSDILKAENSVKHYRAAKDAMVIKINKAIEALNQ